MVTYPFLGGRRPPGLATLSPISTKIQPPLASTYPRLCKMGIVKPTSHSRCAAHSYKYPSGWREVTCVLGSQPT